MRIVHQPEATQIIEPCRDAVARPLQGAGLGVVQHDVVARPAEHDRPGLADQPGADQGNLLLHVRHDASPATTLLRPAP